METLSAGEEEKMEFLEIIQSRAHWYLYLFLADLPLAQ